MAIATDTTSGISVEVDDLVRVRSQLAGIYLKNIQRRTSFRSGAREARLRGRGMEYEESRAYVFGDDVRTMDWRVMARTGEAHTKVFAEEKERRYLLAVDLSASMYFGTKYSYKSWTAAHTCAYLSWLAHEAGDRVGSLVVSPKDHYELRPGKTRSGLLGLFHRLAELSKISQPPCQPGRLNFLLMELHRVTTPGTIITLVSDCISVDEETAELLSQLVKHNDVNIFWIHDEIELNSWPQGSYPVRTAEREFDLDLTTSSASRWLDQQLRSHREQVETLATQLAIPLFPICCNRALHSQLVLNLGDR